MDITEQTEESLLTLELNLLVDVGTVETINQQMQAKINQLSTEKQHRGKMILKGIILLLEGNLLIDMTDFQ